MKGIDLMPKKSTKRAAAKRPAGPRRTAKKKATTRRPQLPADLRQIVEQAIACGSYLIAVVRKEGGRLVLERRTHQFDFANFDPALRLVKRDLDDELAAADLEEGQT